jgi:hypothetical protein
MADPPGTFREIGDPEAEVRRLSRQRQTAAGQVCAEVVRRDGCPMRLLPQRKRTHDPDHCDRVWEAAHA